MSVMIYNHNRPNYYWNDTLMYNRIMGNYQVLRKTCPSLNADEKDHNCYGATFVNQHFAEGDSRYAFEGRIFGNGPRNGNKCVIKMFKQEYHRTFEQCFLAFKTSEISKIYAEIFNNLPPVRNYCSGETISFLIPLIARMEEIPRPELFIPTQSNMQPEEYVTIEPYLDGTYKKFNMNFGWEDGITDLVLAFCHWTWHISGHKVMICDLQGIQTQNEFILTDPVVHTPDGIFGMTDLGVSGMETVLAHHNCNRLCRELSLPVPMTGANIGMGRRCTTYSFQLTEEQRLRNILFNMCGR